MMAFLGFIDIHSLVSDYIIQPLVNTISYGFGLVSATDELRFLEYEREPLMAIVPWKDTLIFTCTVVMAYTLFRSWKTLQQEKYECEQIYKSCCDTDVSGKLSEFAKQTDSSFKDLERKSKEIEKRSLRARTMITKENFLEKFQEELNETRGCWVSKFSTFSLVDLQMDPETNGEWARMVDLFDMEQDFDATISKIEGTLAVIEDGIV